jgi:alpha-L-arabinofuranosidase
VTVPQFLPVVSVRLSASTKHKIDPRLFGVMLERADYMGAEIGAEWAWDPLKRNWRAGFLRLWDDMKATVLRFPGGLRADAYDWRWGIDNVPGMPPRKERKRTVDGKPISDFVGTDEAIALCRRAKAEPLLVVNVMQFEKDPAAGAALAADWVEYCNSPNNGKNPNGGVDWAAVRAKNGNLKPFNVKLWELGNEIHISGRFPAETYGSMLPGYIKAMRAVDQKIELMADAETPALREAAVKHAGSSVQYLVHHIYQPWQTSGKGLTAEEGWYGLVSSPHPAFDAEIDDLKEFIKKSSHKYKIALTEWNANGWWEEHAPLRTGYPYAIVMAGMYNSLLRHSDSIPIACSSMLVGLRWAVNIIRADPEQAQGSYPTPMYWIAKLYNENHGKELLDVHVSNVPTYSTHRAFGSSPARAEIPLLDVVATGGREDIYLHFVNRHASRPIPVNLDFSDLYKIVLGANVQTVAGPAITAFNDFGALEQFKTRSHGLRWTNETIVQIPPASATVIHLKLR